MIQKIAKMVMWLMIGGALWLALAVFISFMFQFIWNYAVAPTFSLPEISYWVALGFVALISFIANGGVKISRSSS